MKRLKKYKFPLLLVLILTLAALLRFPFISVFPPSMVQDEVGLGYTAISIAETGMDEWGAKYPMVFKSFGDYKPPAFFYTTALLYKVIGWQPALPRITSAIAGLFVVLFGSLWIRKLFKSDQAGLAGGLILAISPWTVHMSRMAIESNLGLAFFMGGLLFMSYADKSKIKLVISAVLFSASTYSYHGFRFTIVLFLGTLLLATAVFNYKKIKQQKNNFKTVGLILLISTLLSLPGFLSGGATNRLDQTLSLTSEKTLYLYNHYENNCHVTYIEVHPQLAKLCRIKYNKFSKPILIGTDNLVKHISPSFLFFSGDSDVGRNPTARGELFLVLLPLWMIGILLAFLNFRKNLLILVGYFVSMLPSAAAGMPHAIRMSVHIPFLIAIIIIGYNYLSKKFKHFSILFVSVLLIVTGIYAMQYATDTYATHEGTATYLSYAKDVAKISHDYAANGYIVYADHDLYPEPHMYYAYWNQIDPKIAQESFAEVYEEGTGFTRPTKFGENVFFEAGNIKALACDKEYNKPTVFITNNPIELGLIQTIEDNTNTYKFAYIYDLDSLRADPLALLNFCNH